MLFAVVLAGGIGKRMGNVDKPKQFLLIGGKPIIVHTIEKFYINDCFEKVIVPCPEEWVSYTEDLLARDLKETSRIAVIKGGSDRNGSIVNALNYIRDNYGIDDDTAVVTHDAVRPFVTQRIIDENYSFEKAIARNSNILSQNEARNLSYSRTDVQEAAKNYPILAYLDAWGFQDAPQYMMDIGYVNQLDQLCNESHISEIKSYLIVRYLFEVADLVGSDAIAVMEETKGSNVNPENPQDKSLSDEESDEYHFFEEINKHTALMAAINQFVRSAPQFDDITMLCFHYIGKE